MFVVAILFFGCMYAVLMHICIKLNIATFPKTFVWFPLLYATKELTHLAAETAFVACCIGSAVALIINFFSLRKNAAEESL